MHDARRPEGLDPANPYRGVRRCDECHGVGIAGWFSRNAVGLAAQHHSRTGHTTWAEQVISMQWGERDA